MLTHLISIKESGMKQGEVEKENELFFPA